MEAGGIVPSGECPACGGLCYLETRAPGDSVAVSEPTGRPPTRIIIHVRGGVVQEVRCSDPEADVSVADWDNGDRDSAAREECERLADEGEKLHGVY